MGQQRSWPHEGKCDSNQSTNVAPGTRNSVSTSGDLTEYKIPKHKSSKVYAPPMLPNSPYITDVSAMNKVCFVLLTMLITKVCDHRDESTSSATLSMYLESSELAAFDEKVDDCTP